MAVEGTDGLGPLRDRPILGPRNCGTALKRIFRSFFFANVFCLKNMAVEGTDRLGPRRDRPTLAPRNYTKRTLERASKRTTKIERSK